MPRIYKISSGRTTTQFLSAVTSLPFETWACVLFLISSCKRSKYAALRLIHKCTPPFATSTPWNNMYESLPGVSPATKTGLFHWSM